MSSMSCISDYMTSNIVEFQQHILKYDILLCFVVLPEL